MTARPTATLETPRLFLRPPLLDDLARWAEMMADARSARFIGGVQAKSIVWRTVMTTAGAWTLTGIGMFSVLEKASGRWIGRVGPWHPFGWPGPEVGWALHPDAWGQGYAVEAAAATMSYAFDVLGWEDVIHAIAPDNAASKKVADRIGSAYRGLGRLPAPFDETEIEIWGQTREQWTARRQAVKQALARGCG